MQLKFFIPLLVALAQAKPLAAPAELTSEVRDAKLEARDVGTSINEGRLIDLRSPVSITAL